MAALPNDLVDPSEAFAPATKSPSASLPGDLVDPSQANFGGGAPTGGGEDGSAAKAFGYGVVKGTPGGAKIAAAGVPIA
jgi:hypothetical protein